MKTKRSRKHILTLGFQTTPDLYKRVDLAAKRNYVSRSDILRWAVLEWLKKHEEAA